MSAEQTTASPDASRILIVDDDASVRNVLTALLTAEGYGVSTAASAVEALALVVSSEVHLVISDMKMPERDGFWLLDQMRKEHPQTPRRPSSVCGAAPPITCSSHPRPLI